jgi:NDP-sugar pyrophosphorylase family protein
MKHVIILSGHSQRFLNEGYTIKPLIKINGKTIIEYVLDSLNLQTYEEVSFIIKKEDVESYNLDKFLQNKFQDSKIFIINGHKLGPVYSVLQAQECLYDDKETLITYCDLHINWNINNLYNFINNTNSDGCIVSHTGWHPHRIYNKSFAYLRIDGDSVLEIKEKEHFTDDPETEYASGGIYYFKTGKMIKHYFNKLIESNNRVNNEFYVTMPYNLMIQDGLKVTHFDSKNYLCLGTPKDVELFDSYKKIHNHLNGNDINVFKTWEYFKTKII